MVVSLMMQGKMRRYLIQWCFVVPLCLAAWLQAHAQAADPPVPPDVLSATIAKWQHVPRGPELPFEELEIDLNSRDPKEISSSDAAADVERFFHLLEHGYCGYGCFSEENSFEGAKTKIIEKLYTRDRWPTRELAELTRRHLDFIVDCHLKLGHVVFASHSDFWFVPDLELIERKGIYHITTAEGGHAIISVNGTDPESFVFPSINAAGQRAHLLGTLSLSDPEPLVAVMKENGVETERRYRLTRSEYKGIDLFRSFRLGGIPVVRIRTFSDHHVEQLDAFLRSADELRGEPCVIIDVRGNGGGNTRWPKEWIRRFTGQAPDMNQVLTELVSRTALIGQANYMAWLAAGPGSAIREQLENERDRLASEAAAFAADDVQPYWGAYYLPQKLPIANRTTLVVVIDRAVASSGEGLISYLHNQVENVVLVGENTRGALTFGHMTAHRLPNSKLLAFLPVKLNLDLDLEWREQHGFEPDYWIPARDALNHAVAAIRAGTIPTALPLSQETLAAEFVPESPPRFSRREIRQLLQIVAVILVSVVIAVANRKRGAAIFVLLTVGLATAAIYGFDDNPQARALALLLAIANGMVAFQKLRRRIRNGAR